MLMQIEAKSGLAKSLIIEILIFSCLIGFFLPKGIEYACCSVVIGTTVAEILTCFYSYFIYKKDILKCNNFEISNKREIYKKRKV